MKTFLLHKFELVYPPMSNQEAEWFKDDPDVREAIQKSNLYVIGQRPEAFYRYDKNVLEKQALNKKKVQFKFECFDRTSDVEIDIIRLLETNGLSEEHIDDLELEMGPKFIRFWIDRSSGKEVLDWFTTEKLLFDRSRAHPAIVGFDDYSDYFKYYLHYVGISKKENSLMRLVVKPHDKRIRILSNENPFRGSSRVTDEIVLFFYRISTFQINQLDLDDDSLSKEPFTDGDGNRLRIVADAEKALINIMNAPYNIVKYRGYPKSNDGLFNQGIDRYGYFIGEEIEYITQSNKIIGEYTPYEIGLRNKADLILINGEEVELIRSAELAPAQETDRIEKDS